MGNTKEKIVECRINEKLSLEEQLVILLLTDIDYIIIEKYTEELNINIFDTEDEFKNGIEDILKKGIDKLETLQIFLLRSQESKILASKNAYLKSYFLSSAQKVINELSEEE